jgi:predicted RNA-binding protein
MFGFGKKKSDDGDSIKKTGFIDKMKGKAVQKMFEKQMKDVPENQKKALMGMMEKNPEFAKEIEEETKKGTSQMAAGMKVMRKYQGKMQQLMMESMGGDPRMQNKNLR